MSQNNPLIHEPVYRDVGRSRSAKATRVLSATLPHADRSASDHPEFYYSAKTGRYHYRDTNKFVSSAARENLTRGHINQTRENLCNQTDRLNQISFARWQKETFSQIKIAHTQSYMLGRGGIHEMQPQDYAALSKEMRFQRDRFKLFSGQILDGKLSDAAIRYRLTAYGEATKVSHENGLMMAAKARGATEERNVLGRSEHCPDCVKYTGMGWQPIGTLPRPTKKRQCMYNCQCRMEFRGAEERTDKLEGREGLIKKVITNKQNEQQTVYIRPQDEAAFNRHQKAKDEKSSTKKGQRSSLEQRTLALAKQTFETEELPERAELLAFTKDAIADFMANPIAATAAGIQRERAVRQAYKAATGQDIPSHGKIAFDLMKDKAKVLAKNAAKSADTYIAIAGVAGSAAGGAVAGPVGALAGDLAGSLVTRKAFEAVAAYRKGTQALDSQGAIASAKRLAKLKEKHKTTLAGLKEPEIQQAMEKELVGDVAGWAIGNASGAAIAKLLPAPIPYGAGVCVATVPTLVVPAARKAHEYVRQGMDPAEATQKALTEVFDGAGRERAARAKVTKYIRTAKAIAQASGYALQVAGTLHVLSK